MTTQANAALARSMYEAIFANDLDLLDRILAPDFALKETSALSIGGVYHGRSGLMDFFGKFSALFEVKNIDIVEIVGAEGRAFSLLKLTFGSSEGDVEMLVSEVFTISENKIEALDVFFFDTDVLKKIARS